MALSKRRNKQPHRGGRSISTAKHRLRKLSDKIKKRSSADKNKDHDERHHTDDDSSRGSPKRPVQIRLYKKNHLPTHGKLTYKHVKDVLFHLHHNVESNIKAQLKNCAELKKHICYWARSKIQEMMLAEAIRQRVSIRGKTISKFTQIGHAYSLDGTTEMHNKIHAAIYQRFQAQPGWRRDLEDEYMNAHNMAYEDEDTYATGFVRVLITEQYSQMKRAITDRAKKSHGTFVRIRKQPKRHKNDKAGGEEDDKSCSEERSVDDDLADTDDELWGMNKPSKISKGIFHSSYIRVEKKVTTGGKQQWVASPKSRVVSSKEYENFRQLQDRNTILQAKLIKVMEQNIRLRDALTAHSVAIPADLQDTDDEDFEAQMEPEGASDSDKEERSVNEEHKGSTDSDLPPRRIVGQTPGTKKHLAHRNMFSSSDEEDKNMDESKAESSESDLLPRPLRRNGTGVKKPVTGRNHSTSSNNKDTNMGEGKKGRLPPSNPRRRITGSAKDAQKRVAHRNQPFVNDEEETDRDVVEKGSSDSDHPPRRIRGNSDGALKHVAHCFLSSASDKEEEDVGEGKKSSTDDSDLPPRRITESTEGTQKRVADRNRPSVNDREDTDRDKGKKGRRGSDRPPPGIMRNTEGALKHVADRFQSSASDKEDIDMGEEKGKSSESDHRQHKGRRKNNWALQQVINMAGANKRKPKRSAVKQKNYMTYNEYRKYIGDESSEDSRAGEEQYQDKAKYTGTTNNTGQRNETTTPQNLPTRHLHPNNAVDGSASAGQHGRATTVDSKKTRETSMPKPGGDLGKEKKTMLRDSSMGKAKTDLNRQKTAKSAATQDTKTNSESEEDYYTPEPTLQVPNDDELSWSVGAGNSTDALQGLYFSGSEMSYLHQDEEDVVAKQKDRKKESETYQTTKKTTTKQTLNENLKEATRKATNRNSKTDERRRKNESGRTTPIEELLATMSAELDETRELIQKDVTPGGRNADKADNKKRGQQKQLTRTIISTEHQQECDTDGSTTESECDFEHSKYDLGTTYYAIEDQKELLFVLRDLACNLCNIPYGKGKGEWKPGQKTPVYACNGMRCGDRKCCWAVCGNCFGKEQLKMVGEQTSMRTRRRT